MFSVVHVVTSCRKSSMRKWRKCTFLHSVQSSLSRVVKLAPQDRVQKRTVEQVVNVSMKMQSQLLLIQEVQETMEVPQGQYIDRIVDVTVSGSTKYVPSEQCTSRQHRRRWRMFQRQSSMFQKDGRDPPSAVH